MRSSTVDSLSGAGCLALAAADSALEPAQSAARDVRRPVRPLLTGRLELMAIRLVAGPRDVRPAGGVGQPGGEVGPGDAHRQAAARLLAVGRGAVARGAVGRGAVPLVALPLAGGHAGRRREK